MKTIFLCLIMLTGFSLFAQTVKDIDRNEYKIVKVDNQWWMAENLKVTKTNDGKSVETFIPVKDGTALPQLGLLYKWDVLQKVCPAGWHAASADEWDKLIEYLGGWKLAGGKMKITGTDYWKSPNGGATNETGLSVYPCGFLTSTGKYNDNKGRFAYFWSSTSADANTAWGYYLTYGEPTIYKYSYTFTKDMGMAVRCVKD